MEVWASSLFLSSLIKMSTVTLEAMCYIERSHKKEGATIPESLPEEEPAINWKLLFWILSKI